MKRTPLYRPSAMAKMIVETTRTRASITVGHATKLASFVARPAANVFRGVGCVIRRTTAAIIRMRPTSAVVAQVVRARSQSFDATMADAYPDLRSDLADVFVIALLKTMSLYRILRKLS